MWFLSNQTLIIISILYETENPSWILKNFLILTYSPLTFLFFALYLGSWKGFGTRLSISAHLVVHWAATEVMCEDLAANTSCQGWDAWPFPFAFHIPLRRTWFPSSFNVLSLFCSLYDRLTVHQVWSTPTAFWLNTTLVWLLKQHNISEIIS